MMNSQSTMNGKGVYLQYTQEDMIKCLRRWYNCTDPNEKVATVLDLYFHETTKRVALTSFYRYCAKLVDLGAESGGSTSLNEIRKKAMAVGAKRFSESTELALAACRTKAEAVIAMIFVSKKKNQKSQLEDLHKNNCLLTANEEAYLVQLCKILGYGGHGLDRDKVLMCINLISPGEHSQSAVDGFFNRHPELKLKGTSGIDPLRASQANENVQATFFCKLNAYIEILHAMGSIKWKSFADIPSKFKYNMDEVASDTTKRRKKVATDSEVQVRAYTITPEGDRMPFHVTVCLTTRADGQYISPVDGITEGAPPPVIIHSKKAPKDPNTIVDPYKLSGNLVHSLALMNPSLKHLLRPMVARRKVICFRMPSTS